LNFLVFIVKNGLAERLICNQRLLASDAQQSKDLLFEHAKDNVKAADAAQQDLKNHAPRTGVNIKSKNKPGQQWTLLLSYAYRQ
jgi:hypothetical protein